MLKFVIAAIAAGTAASAFAAPAGPFDGPFVGVQGGWQRDRQGVAVANTAGTVFSARESGSGFAYGGQVGFDLRLNPSVVLGGELSASGVTSGDDRYFDGNGNGFERRVGRTLSATGRAGFLIRPDGLAYVRGGYSNARFDLNGFGEGGRNRDGFVVGVGYEQYLSRSVSARVEYDYSQYGRGNVREAASDAGPGAVRTNYKRDAVTAGVNLHF